MTPAVLVALLTCSIAALFDWRIATGLALALLWIVSGRDPLWTAAAVCTWLRGQFIRASVALRVAGRTWRKVGTVSVAVAREQEYRAQLTNAMLPVTVEGREG